MTLQERAAIVGQYPTAGLGGSVDAFLMPEGITVQFTKGRAVDADGNIHIEGKGVAPTVRVPVNEETLFSEGDPVLEAAIAHLDSATGYDVQDGGEIAVGDSVSGEITAGSRVRYVLHVEEGDYISIFVGDEAGTLDTVLRIYDEEDNLLLANDDDPLGETVNSAIEELEIPADLTLIIEVGTRDDAGEGIYTLRIVDLEASN
jgi:hypothetical protein